MHSVGLSNNRLYGPKEVIRWLGAVQSQDYGPAKWSVAQRTAGVTDATLDQAFGDGAFLRTHILRPTWHFVVPEDIRWMLELTAPRVQMQIASFYRLLELDDIAFTRCNGTLIKTLQGGRQCTRQELSAALAGSHIATTPPRLGAILMNAELTAIICSGALRGKQHTYALLAERAPQARRLTRDEALAELTLRYFRSHGPATLKDFRWWSSLTITDIKRGLDAVGSLLVREVIDSVPYWFDPSEPHPCGASPAIHLLQTYDEYVVGYSESRHVCDVSGAARSMPGVRGIYNPAILLDGQIAGHWKRTVSRDSVIVEAVLFAPLTEARSHALQVAVARLGDFLGLPATVLGTEVWHGT
jgi:hypothetical protein